MLTMRVHRGVFRLKRTWQCLYGQGDFRSAYQSYYVNRELYKRIPIYALQKKYLPLYCEILEDGVPIMIAPLCKYVGKNVYCAMGQVNGFQVYDFIYGNALTTEKMKECITYMIESLHMDELLLANVPTNSLIYACRNDLGRYSVEVSENDHVNICFDGDYEKWFGSLTKHARQNIRTAYNRMQGDAVSFSCDIKRGEALDRSTLKNVLDIYCQRHTQRYGVKTSTLKRIYLEYLDFSTACQQHYSDNFSAILYLNNKVAAFMTGLVEKNGTSAVIPRLSIVDEFARYSPGMVLICEAAKRFSGDLHISNLDLSKGAEGYKLSAGGKIYHTYNVTMWSDK